MILVIEDLHWADEATLDVMTTLGQRAELAPALVIATYRDDELARHCGRCWASCGWGTRCGEPLRRAYDALQAPGARRAAAIVARKLRERGVRGVPRGPRPRTRANPGGLTARELEVLALLAKGLQNAAIAAQLVVSEKTVDHHVSAILRKLDVRTRGEAAAEAARPGLAGPR